MFDSASTKTYLTIFKPFSCRKRKPGKQVFGVDGADPFH